jgi:hypothetical protein
MISTAYRVCGQTRACKAASEPRAASWTKGADRAPSRNKDHPTAWLQAQRRNPNSTFAPYTFTRAIDEGRRVQVTWQQEPHSVGEPFT